LFECYAVKKAPAARILAYVDIIDLGERVFEVILATLRAASRFMRRRPKFCSPAIVSMMTR